MEKLWLANIAPGTSDEELKAFVRKYSRDVECAEILHVDGDGSRPAVIMSFTGKKFDTLGKLSLRLNACTGKGGSSPVPKACRGRSN
jgi:hypothetical protein